MDPIEVTASFSALGEIKPVNFRWQGRAYQVVSTGRRWEVDGRTHILVMTPGDRVFELVFSAMERAWYLKPRPGSERHAV